MTRETTLCPSVDALEECAAGRDVGEAIDAHIQACPVCAREVERIRGDNEFLSELIEIDRASAAGAPPPMPPPSLGQLGPDFVPGYEIVSQIYAGGQGVVYEARQSATRRRVAVKVLSRVYAPSSPRTRRFEREIEVIAAMRHPNIVTVFDSGTTTDARLFFAMEYIDGHTLETGRHHLKSNRSADRSAGRASDLPSALALFSQITRAVAHAHRHGVIHRDLKPSNIIIDATGAPRLVDFGLAKLTGPDADAGVTLTVSGEFMGTLTYAAPEQLSGHADEVDIRTDVYALGVILYEMVTGHLPYAVAGSMSDIVTTITQTEPRRPSTISRDVDDDLEVIILKALAKTPERRYRSAGALADDIDHYLSGAAIDARRDSTWYVFRKTLRRYRFPAALLGLAIVLLAAFAVLMTYQATRIARERDRADAGARESEFQRGRALTAAGHIAAAEELLWREFLDVPEPAALGKAIEPPVNPPVIDEGGSPHAFWALWELHSRTQCLATLTWNGSPLRGAVFSPDGATLASGGADGVIRLWPVRTGDEGKTELLRVGGELAEVAFAPNGRTLAGRSEAGALTLWDLDERPFHRRPLSLAVPAYSVAFAPDGSFAIGRNDGVIELWDAHARRRRSSLTGPDGGPVSVVFSPDGALLASARQEGVDLWSLADRRVIHSAALDPLGWLRGAGASFSPDGRFVLFSRQASVYRWNAPFTDPPATGPHDPPWIKASATASIARAFQPGGDLLALGLFNSVIELWDLDTAQRVEVLAGHSGPVSAVDFSPDGDLLASSSRDGTVRIWDVAPRRAELAISGFEDSINAISFSDDGHALASASGVDLGITIWDALTGRRNLAIGRAHEKAVVEITYSPDGRTLASAGHDHLVRLWDASSGECVRTLAGHADWVQTARFSPDGTLLASGSLDRTVRLWDVKSGACVAILDEPTGRVPRVRFSPDGTRLAACGDALLVWDVAARPAESEGASAAWSPPVVREFKGHTGTIRAIAWSPGGTWLASGGDDLTIRLWDAVSGACLRTLEGHALHVFALDVSPDGLHLASGDRGGEVRLWDVASGRHLLTLAAGGDIAPPILDVAFSPDGRTLAAGTMDPSIRLWDLTYYARHIAGNLEYQVGRLPKEQRDTERIRDLRAWAARVRAGSVGGSRGE